MQNNNICCFAYLAIKVVKHLPFIMFKSMKTQVIHNNNSLLYVPAAIWQFTKTHVHFTFTDNVTSCDIETLVVTQYCFILCIFCLKTKQVIVLNI